jgi:arylsulfatase A-like enzyme
VSGLLADAGVVDDGSLAAAHRHHRLHRRARHARSLDAQYQAPPAPYSDRLALDAPTLAKAMKSAGYATFFAGKWHLGPEGWWPENQGFDHNLGGNERGGPYGGKRYFSPYGNPRLKDGPDGEHLPDRLATETANFIAANRDRPFFAYYSFYDVHTPLMARPDLQKKYEEKRARLGLTDKWGREGERDVRLVQEHAIYAGHG